MMRQPEVLVWVGTGYVLWLPVLDQLIQDGSQEMVVRPYYGPMATLPEGADLYVVRQAACKTPDGLRAMILDLYLLLGAVRILVLGEVASDPYAQIGMAGRAYAAYAHAPQSSEELEELILEQLQLDPPDRSMVKRMLG